MAQKSKTIFLERIKEELLNTDYAISLLSSTDGADKYFCENETTSHIFDQREQGSPVNIIQTRSLDSLMKKKFFSLPFLIKIDVQGNEMKVIKGASRALLQANVCLLEVSLIKLGDNSPLLLDMLNFMDRNGFQAYDICQFMRRPLDQALFQMDVLFVKKDSSLICEKRWN